MSFSELNIIKPIQSAITGEGYTIPTPVQQQAIPIILERKDLIGSAQTGTGKTAAFAIPILQILTQEQNISQPKNNFKKKADKPTIKALIITPTRELAHQVSDSFTTYGKNTTLRNCVVYGGVSQFNQIDKLRKGVDILIATPGRLLDLMNQNYINLSHIKILVLDEADRMLDMGFINDVKKIIAKLPVKRQSLFFSATMPSEILKLANTILNNPSKVEITPEIKTVEAIKQGVYFVSKPDKKKLLSHILTTEDVLSALVFTRTKRGADVVTKFLNSSEVQADAIHGNKSQSARQRALNNFKLQRTKVLVATDIAARGIDIDKLSHVINYDMPDFSETYIHRIGRTGRAGLGGIALSFCDAGERSNLNDINRLIKTPIPVIDDHPFKSSEVIASGDDLSIKRMNSNKNGTARSAGKSKKEPRQFGTKKRWVKKSKSVVVTKNSNDEWN
jgi:ATP-dependent RNA helicase RhlE